MKRAELLKTAKPILFNTDMVRAILDGRKSETRRVIKLKYDNTHIEICNNKYGKSVIELQNQVEGETFGVNPDGTHFQKLLGAVDKHPPYNTGDILYVRETWNYGYFDCSDFEYRANEYWFEELPRGTKTSLGDGRYVYRAEFSEDDLDELEYKNEDGYRGISWHPSIHMPKKAARIFLRVTDVRVERLQDCGKGWCLGIEKEGIETPQDPILYINDDYYHDALREEMKKLWDSTIPKKDRDKYGWDANPWVWLVEFERIEVEE